MKWINILLFITFYGGTWRLVRPTCVLESDFGFILNCAFKKSGLFRVRNLGGVKAHIGLGFSVGDELGFKESISNLEINRRRSTQVSKLQSQLIEAQQKAKNNDNAIRVRSPASSPSIQTMNQVPSLSTTTTTKLHPLSSTGGSNLPFVPPFKPIPPAQERPAINLMNHQITNNTKTIAMPALMGIAVPKSSISRLSAGPTVSIGDNTPTSSANRLSSTNFALRTLPTPNNNDLTPLITSNSIQALLVANNITEDMLQTALLQRQKMLARIKATTTTTTLKPVGHRYTTSVGKVMNAPKEYYPVGYDKNFDDNFSSRVELPETSFYCGDQKHFPGLYADEDLGCMVFHVCALTDDGLIMKSFLCPESTLFDQTILKCNWWFYVDCKNSKKLYDSNIPISKSYQLMKALTFFSSYKNNNKDSSSSSSSSSNISGSTTQKSNDKD